MVGINIGLTDETWWLGSDKLPYLSLNLIDFRQTKKYCIGNPLNNLGSYSIFKTGTTQNYIKVITPCRNNTPVTNVPQVILPYGSPVQATHMPELYLIPLLTTRASTYQIFSHLHSDPFVSIGQIWNYGFTFTFAKTFLIVDNQG